MPLPMFRNRIYLLATICMFAVGIGMMGTMFALPFFLQGAQGISATNSGLVTLPTSVGIVLASIFCGQIMARTGHYKPLAIIGGIGTVAALFLLSRLTVDTNLNWTRLYMLLMGCSMGTLMPLYTLLVQNSLPFPLLGAGTAANQFFRQIGAAVGTALFGTLIVTGFSSRLTDAFPTGLEQLKESPNLLLQPAGLARLADVIDTQTPGASEGVIATARVALAGPVTDVFLYASIVMIIAIVVAVLLPKVRFRTQAEMMQEMMAMRAAADGGSPPGGPHGGPPGGPPGGGGLSTEAPIVAGAPAAPPALVGSAASTGPAASIAQRAPSDAGANMQLVASWAEQRPTGNGGGSGD